MDEVMSDAPTGTPAPYGRACTNCARAKCRCIYRSEDESAVCERCHRLKKECVPSVSVRKRNGRRMIGSRTAQLEEKLEDLVMLLRSQAAKPGIVDIATQPGIGISTPSPSNQSAATSSQAIESPSQVNSNPTPDTTSPTATAGSNLLAPCSTEMLTGRRSPAAILHSMFEHKPEDIPSCLPACPHMPSPQEAEERLTIFRTQMLHFFPLVYLHPLMTAKQLLDDKPFLWFTIMTAACPATTPQLAMSNAVKRHIADKIVMESEKSLDLLLGLVVYAGWSHFHKKDKPYLTVMASLINAMVFDLLLNKMPTDMPQMLCFRAFPYEPPKAAAPKVRTLEERRTMLACFYITSVIAFDLRKFDTMTWTPHMDECVQVLSQEAECLGDKVLLHLVKTQLVIDQLNKTPWLGRDGAAPTIYFGALRSRLEQLRAEVPPELVTHEVVVQSLLYLELIIHEAFFSKEPQTIHSPDFARFELLNRALEIIGEWFDRFFTIPLDRYIGMNFAFWCQMAHCLMTLSWLTMRDDPVWNRAEVLQKIDILTLCDRMSDNLTAVAERRRLRAGPQVDDDIFTKSPRLIANMKESWRAEMRAAGLPTSSSDADAAPAVIAPGSLGETKAQPAFVDGVTTGPLAMPMSQFWADDAWLSDIFNVSWE